MARAPGDSLRSLRELAESLGYELVWNVEDIGGGVNAYDERDIFELARAIWRERVSDEAPLPGELERMGYFAAAEAALRVLAERPKRRTTT